MKSNAQVVAERVLAEAGLALTPSGELNVLAELTTFGTIVPNQPVTVMIDGDTMPVAEWLDGLTRSTPSYFQPAERPAASTVAELPANATLTERMAHRVALDKARNRARDLAADAAKGTNPYAVATRNVTRQMLIQKGDPALAAKLQAEATR